MEALKNSNILITSNEPWGDIWYTKHNYAYELSKTNKVFFLNPPKGWRQNSLKNIKIRSEKINGQIFNVGFKNQSVNDLASDVKEVVGEDIKIINTKSDDNRSYHVCSEKIKEILGFKTKHTVKDAVKDLKNAFEKNLLVNSLQDEKYFNIKRMQSIKLV